ncbi:MAG: BsaWI family type II restriction enzyme [bacterium]|nr:BsaWI family type II restriction enzyme [bacterium]
MLLELRAIGTSIANTMRPLAGNTFSAWVSELLNKSFESRSLPMRSFTTGPLKVGLSKKFVIREGDQRIDLRPDIDIVVAYQSPNRQAVPLAIISAKTTLAERVMQTINWTRYKTDERLPEEVRSIKLYLVTAWETFAESDVNRERVQELDGVYVCNTKFQRYGNIKPFEEMLDDLKSLLPDEAISSS